jgi:ADP-glucose pyrophosphorylase
MISTAKHGATADGSLIAGDCTVRGTVQRSVVFDGAEIRRHATVSDAVILPGAVIGAGCRLRGVIVDSGCRVPAGTIVDRSGGAIVPIERLKPTVLTGDVTAQLDEGRAASIPFQKRWTSKAPRERCCSSA